MIALVQSTPVKRINVRKLNYWTDNGHWDRKRGNKTDTDREKESEMLVNNTSQMYD